MEKPLHSLELLLEALDASCRNARRDDCGDRVISGRAGHIYTDGDNFLVVVMAGSPRRWTGIKRRLAFCRLSQDGDTEGCLQLGHLPSRSEAALIRDAIRLKRRRHLSPEAIAKARANLKAVSSPDSGGF
jgi:hypothetical protein